MTATMRKPTKKCPKCKRLLPVDEFCKDPRNEDGLHLYCRKCVKTYFSKTGPGRGSYKICPGCDINTHMYNFGGDISRKDGYARLCKKCKGAGNISRLVSSMCFNFPVIDYLPPYVEYPPPPVEPKTAKGSMVTENKILTVVIVGTLLILLGFYTGWL